MIYLICFGGSALLMCAALKLRKRKALFLLFSVLSIALPVLLAGLRDYSIGIDTSNYMQLKRYWLGANKSYDSLWRYLKYYHSVGFGEYLFGFVVGIVAQTTHNYSVFLIVVHAIIVTGVYIGAVRQRAHANPALVLLLFYLFFFNQSLNIMRQFMAMAIVFAFLADIEQKKYVRYVIAVLVASMFHTSAILALASLFVYWIMYADFSKVIHKFKPSVRSRFVFVAVALSCVVMAFPILCRLLLNVGILPSRYGWFLNSDKVQHTTLITLCLLMELGIVFVLRKQMLEYDASLPYLAVSSVAYLILHQISAWMIYGKRIAYYFAMGNIVTVAMIPSSFQTKKQRILVLVALLCFAVGYWWYTYVLNNASRTYPYQFIF